MVVAPRITTGTRCEQRSQATYDPSFIDSGPGLGGSRHNPRGGNRSSGCRALLPSRYHVCFPENGRIFKCSGELWTTPRRPYSTLSRFTPGRTLVRYQPLTAAASAAHRMLSPLVQPHPPRPAEVRRCNSIDISSCSRRNWERRRTPISISGGGYNVLFFLSYLKTFLCLEGGASAYII